MKYATIRALILSAPLTIVAASAAACRDTPTAPTAVTWTIAPTSAVMRTGDTVVFRVTSSAPPESLPVHGFSPMHTAIFEVRNSYGDLPGIGSGAPLPRTGEFSVTLVQVFERGRVSFTVSEILSQPQRTVVEAAIDVEM